METSRPDSSTIELPPGQRRRGAAIAVLAFASFIDLMDVTIVNVALPAIRADLDATAAALEWVVGGYALAFAAVLVTGARLGDVRGRRTVFVLGVGGFTLASLAACLAPGPGLLVAARLAQGLFGALMVPQLLSSIQALYPPKERAPLYGVVGLLAGLAAVIGPMLGGWLITNDAFGMGWRSIFVINVPIGLLIIVAALVVVPNTRTEHADALDLAGAALFTAGVGALVYGLVEGRQLGWPAWLWAVMAASPVLLGVFVAQQRRRERAGRAPLIPMSLFADRGFTSGVVTQFAFQASMVGMFLVLAIYLQTGLQFSPWESGLTLLAFSLGSLAGSGATVPLVARLGKALPLAGAVLMGGGAWWTAVIARDRGTGLGVWSLAPALVIAGVGLAMIVIPLVDVALATVPLRYAGAASGAFNTVQQVGAALGVAVVGLVFFDRAGRFSQPELLDAYRAGIGACVAGFAVCVLAGLFLPPAGDVRRHAEQVQEWAAVDAPERIPS